LPNLGYPPDRTANHATKGHGTATLMCSRTNRGSPRLEHPLILGHDTVLWEKYTMPTLAAEITCSELTPFSQ